MLMINRKNVVQSKGRTPNRFSHVLPSESKCLRLFILAQTILLILYSSIIGCQQQLFQGVADRQCEIVPVSR